MGLLPEFFVLLGIVIFLAMSLLSFLLQDYLPSVFQYLFQIAGGGGFGVLFLGQGLTPTDPSHFSISVGYLACALSSVLGLNAYLLLVRKKMVIASTFSGTVTLPILMISALLISSYIGNAGEVSVAPSTIGALAVVALVTNLGIFIFLRKLSKQSNITLGDSGLTPKGPVSIPLEVPGLGLKLALPSVQGEEQWEGPSKEEVEGGK